MPTKLPQIDDDGERLYQPKHSISELENLFEFRTHTLFVTLKYSLFSVLNNFLIA